MLADDIQIARLLQRRSIARILAEVLILRVHLDSSDQRWRNAGSDKRCVFAVPDMVKLKRPETRSFLRWIVSEERYETLERCRKRHAVFRKSIQRRRQRSGVAKKRHG